MKNQELFKAAIADAKTVRDAALANAKKSLEEAFNPKVESMLSKKLAEMEAKELAETEDQNEGTQHGSMEEELESVLKELGMSEETDVNESDDVNENEDEMPTDEPTDMEGGEDDADFGGEELEGGDQPQDVAELTVDQFTDIIRSVVQDVLSGGGEAEAGMDDMGGDLEGGDLGGEESEEEIDLDELIAELDGDVNESEDLDESEDVNEGEDLDEASDELKEAEDDVREASQKLKEAKQWYDKKTKGGKKIRMKEVRKGVEEAKAWYMSKKAKKGSAPKIKEAAVKKVDEASKKELAEAVKVIRTLRETLSSTNLLNAKLLYANKIFKAKSLTESQKVKIVNAFDKAKTKEEAKMIYESLNDTLSSKNKKNTLKESIGFASKVISSPKRTSGEIIVEDAAVARMQRLAGIK